MGNSLTHENNIKLIIINLYYLKRFNNKQALGLRLQFRLIQCISNVIHIYSIISSFIFILFPTHTIDIN